MPFFPGLVRSFVIFQTQVSTLLALGASNIIADTIDY